MKTLFVCACFVFASHAFAAECVTNAQGKVVCANGTQAVIANPNTGHINTTQSSSGEVRAVTSANGNSAAAYNPRTGNAAVAQKGANGVTTTHTSKGGESKTMNGKGVYKAPNGTKCVRTASHKGCT